MAECEEAGCRYPATHTFKGKSLCKDCWEKYKEKESQMLQELRDMG